MKCPVCSKEMVPENFGINVDVCENGCKGIWLDHDELQNLDENNEGLGEALRAALNYPRVNDENRGQLLCPKCNIPMQTHKYKRSKEVNIDECYNCGGFFLDSGELKEIRDTYMSDQEVHDYMQKLINGIPEYQKEQADLKKLERREEAINRFTKFLRISYWLGKGKDNAN
jgi:Zn-finger nucleic acid-binding protein